MATYSVEIKADEVSFRALISALRHEADGAALRRDLAKKWRRPAAAAAAAAKAGIAARMSGGSQHGVKLREAIAAGVKAHVRTRPESAGSRPPGMSVQWHRSPMRTAIRSKHKRNPQNPDAILWRAGWLLDEGRVWSHPTFGRGPVTTAVPRAKGWFTDSVNPFRPAMLQAVRDAYKDLLDRIGHKSRG